MVVRDHNHVESITNSVTMNVIVQIIRLHTICKVVTPWKVVTPNGIYIPTCGPCMIIVSLEIIVQIQTWTQKNPNVIQH
jgi:hypothetical protein